VTPADHLRNGDAFAAAADYRAAALEYQLAAQGNQRPGEARRRLATTLMRLGDRRRALEEFVRAADLLPRDVGAQLAAGRVLLLAGAFADAKARADLALAIDATNVDAQVLRGNALVGLKDIDAATGEFEEAIALDPTYAPAYASLAGVQVASGNRDEAEATFTRAVDAAPTSITARLALGHFLWSTGRWRETEALFNAVIDMKPDDATANRALGLLYLTSGRGAEAEKFFRAIAEHTTDGSGTLALADYYIVMKRYRDAREAIAGVADRHETHAAAVVRLAAMDAAAGDRTGALQRLRELTRSRPRHVPALVLEARILLETGDRQSAVSAAEEVVSSDPGSAGAVEAHLIAGIALLSAGRINDAAGHYREALRLRPRSTLALLSSGALELARGDAQAAVAYARQTMEIEPGNAAARALLVRGEARLGQNAEADRDLRPLQRSIPQSAAVANLEGRVLLEAKQFGGARAAYGRSLAASPQNLEALQASVQLDLARGDRAAAVAAIERRLQQPPVGADVFLLAARTFGAAGDEARAERLLRRAIEVDPERLEGYSMLGALYAGRGRLAEAEREYRRLVDRNPKSVSSQTVLAMLLEQQHKGADAEHEYRRALAIDPDAAVAANNLAWMYASTKRDLSEALQLAEAAYRRLPDHPSINDTLGWAHHQLGQSAEAIPYLDRAATHTPTSALYQYHLGAAQTEAGHFVEGRRALERAFTLAHDFDGAADARKLLASLSGSSR
jgi:tetratricopeptide (TPR) repeat protein